MSEERNQQPTAEVQQPEQPPVENPAESAPAEPSVPVEEAEYQQTEPPKKKGKKKFVIATVAALCVVIAGAFFLLNGKQGGSAAAEFYATSAFLSEDGEAYFVLENGNVVHLEGEFSKVSLTADRQHIAALTKDGDMIVTDPKQSQKKTVASNVEDLNTVKNDGILYTDENDNLYRVLFSDLEPQKIGEDIAAAVAEDNVTMLYATNDGGIYRLLNTENEPTKIGYFAGSISLEAVSNDGNMGVWLEKSGDTWSTILLENEDKETLTKRDSHGDSCFVTFSEDQGLMVVGSLYDSDVWIKRPGQETVRAKMGAELGSSTVYTTVGTLGRSGAKSGETLFVAAEADSGENIYQISKDGEREKILSSVSDFSIAQGAIAYCDDENGLYVAKLEKGTVTGEKKIASDVQDFHLTTNGKYLYYIRNAENGEGSLYCFKLGEKEPVKISSNASLFQLGTIFTMMDGEYASDGASVWYYKDMEKISDAYTRCGTLMYWHYGDKESQKISSDVISGSVTSGLEGGAINPGDYRYMKYVSIDKNEQIHVNVMHSDGNQSVKAVSDVIN